MLRSVRRGRVGRLFGACGWLVVALAAVGPARAQPEASAAGVRAIPIRVVVVTMFEVGNDQGDQPGELQTWVERLPLPERLPFPHGYRHLRYNPDKGVLAVVTGLARRARPLR